LNSGEIAVQRNIWVVMRKHGAWKFLYLAEELRFPA
jgi:hypothetical protein